MDVNVIINNYIHQEKHSNLLLMGSKGLPMLEDAIKIASFLLETKNVNNHPDYLYIHLTSKKTLGVETVEQIIDRANLIPSIASKIVIVIDDFNKMTVSAQNKLLKTLEENNNVIIIGIAYEDTLLPTVKSRMQKVEYSPLSESAFFSYCNEQGINNCDISALYYACGGIAGQIDSSNDLLEIFTKVGKCIEDNKEIELLRILSIAKEKDFNSFYQKYEDKVGSLIAFIGRKYTNMLEKGQLEVLPKLDVCIKNKDICTYQAYTKDLFFEFITDII